MKTFTRHDECGTLLKTNEKRCHHIMKQEPEPYETPSVDILYDQFNDILASSQTTEKNSDKLYGTWNMFDK